MAITSLDSVNQLIFVMVKCGVLFEVRTGFLDNIYTRFVFEWLNVRESKGIIGMWTPYTESSLFWLCRFYIHGAQIQLSRLSSETTRRRKVWLRWDTASYNYQPGWNMSCYDVTLATHPHLLPRSWMSWSYTFSPPCATAGLLFT
jgi:hypothetical protein